MTGSDGSRRPEASAVSAAGPADYGAPMLARWSRPGADRRGLRSRPPAASGLAAALSLALLAAACSNGGGAAEDGAAGGSASTTTASASASATGAPETTTTADPADVPARASDGCQIAGRGLPPVGGGEAVEQTLGSSGVERSYFRFLPLSYDATTPLPLVIDLHGYMEGAAIQRAMSGLETFAEEHSFLVLTPQGLGEIPYWNAFANDGLTDDVKFLRDLIDTTATGFCIDERRVYVTGLSMGAFMTSLVGCRLADRVAAIAPVAGLRFPTDCVPANPVPVVAFHGTADDYVTYDGHSGSGAESLSFNDETMSAFAGFVSQPVPDALEGWARAEGCATAPEEEPVTESVTLIRYGACDGGSVVELYRVDGAGHTWPGSEFSANIENVVGPTTFDIDANEIMWAFFLAHPLPD